MGHGPSEGHGARVVDVYDLDYWMFILKLFSSLSVFLFFSTTPIVYVCVCARARALYMSTYLNLGPSHCSMEGDTHERVLGTQEEKSPNSPDPSPGIKL